MTNCINNVSLKGKVSSGLKKLNYGNLYEFELSIKRFSGVCDTVNVMFDKDEFEYETIDKIDVGNFLSINGYVSTYNSWNPVENKKNLMVKVRATQIDEAPAESYLNHVHVEGTLTKDPILRQTPQKNIDIIDTVIHNVFNDNHNFVPIIAWDKGTSYLKNAKKGDFAIIKGRFQSRAYYKHFEDGSTVSKTAYEVSAYYVETIDIHPNANIF